MEATWEITFTHQFERDAKRLKKSGNDNWLESLAFLKDGPSTSSKQFKALKNYSKAFRWRKGDLRVIFRVIGKTKSILLLAADHRKSVYKRQISSNQAVVGKLDDLLNPVEFESSALAHAPFEEPPQESFTFGMVEEDSTLEEMFVDEADLFLIGIPEAYHPTLLDAESLTDLAKLAIPVGVRQRLEDYLTAPGAHHVGRIYALDRADSLDSIAEQDLGHFLVALDPQQIGIVDRSFSGGPWLIRGGPGTGKTLINLARIRRICNEDIGRDMLNTKPIRIGFVTFNRPLSKSAESMFQAITQSTRGARVEFSTFDAMINRLIGLVGRKSSPIIDDRDATKLIDRVFAEFRSERYDERYIQQVRGRRSDSFFVDEFNETILGCGLHREEDYLQYPRKGRKVSLQPKERGLIYAIYRQWLGQLKDKHLTTFAAKRLAVLNFIAQGKLQIEDERFDFLFVDELQDLSVVAIRVLTHLVKHTENLTFTADTAQSIYLKSPSWSNISDKIRFHAGNSFILRKSYRMTRQIDQAVSPLRLNSGDTEKENDGIDQAIFSGERPCWLNCRLEEHPRIAAQLAQSLTNDNGVNPGQIAVITPDKRTTELVGAEFKNLALPVDYVQAKRKIDIHSQAAHLLNVHVAKGLEFPFVIVIGVVDGNYPNGYALSAAKDDDQKQEEIDKSRRLLYVALSRAARGLWMLTDPMRPSPLLESLNPEDWDVPGDTQRNANSG